MGEELVLPLGSHTSGRICALLTCSELESLLLKNNCSIAICSDSLTAIKAVLAHKPTTGLVADTVTALKTLATLNSVRLIWVPGHCGIAGNEKLNTLAKQASTSCFIGPEPSIGISVFTIRSSISPWAFREQNRLWHESSGCRQAEYSLHRPDYSQARFAPNLARKDLRILVGLLTGHVDLNRHLCIMGIRQDAGCPLCQEEDDTTVHLIAQCSASMLLRKDNHEGFTLSLDTLSDIHWLLLLRFANVSKRFHRP